MISTLLAFVLTIIIIAGIARYNESNKLFWTLLVPFLMGFAVVAMTSKKRATSQEEKIVMQNNPTQAAAISPDAFMYLLAGQNDAAPKKATSNPVGQDSSEAHNDSLSTSKIAVKTRDQPNDTIKHDTS